MTKVKERTEDEWGFLPKQNQPKRNHLTIATKAQRKERLQELEDKLLETSLTTLADALSFRDIDAGAEQPAPEWGDLDPDEQIKRLRMANAAWLNKKEAPVGLDLSKQIAVGIIKARATEKAAPKTLNVVQIGMSAPLPEFPVVELEDDRG